MKNVCMFISILALSFFSTSCGKEEVPPLIYFAIEATFHEQYDEQYGNQGYVKIHIYESEAVPNVWNVDLYLIRDGVRYDLTNFVTVIKKCDEEYGISITLLLQHGDTVGEDIDWDGIPEQIETIKDPRLPG